MLVLSIESEEIAVYSSHGGVALVEIKGVHRNVVLVVELLKRANAHGFDWAPSDGLGASLRTFGAERDAVVNLRSVGHGEGERNICAVFAFGISLGNGSRNHGQFTRGGSRDSDVASQVLRLHIHGLGVGQTLVHLAEVGGER